MNKDYNDQTLAHAQVIYANAYPVDSQQYPQSSQPQYSAPQQPTLQFTAPHTSVALSDQHQQNQNHQQFDQNHQQPHAPSINEGGAREFLFQNKWPVGLQDTFIKNLPTIAHRFFICDDSGSMATDDGFAINGRPQDTMKSIVKCSRWAEVTAALKFLATLACATASPTEFRLLNTGTPIVVGRPDRQDAARYQSLIRLFEGSPGGGTPLCHHIREVTKEIQRLEVSLRASGQKALLVIASDGEASDGDVTHAMRPLKNLPVWVVVRLCTSEDRVVDYWNNVDRELELNMDVVDDVVGEAKEIYSLNRWLTYGEPLQRLREFGLSVKELDLLDEKRLSLEELRKVCAYIYGGTVDSYPHPEANWTEFIATINRHNAEMPKIWNPITKKLSHWIDTAVLTTVYKKSGVCVIA